MGNLVMNNVATNVNVSIVVVVVAVKPTIMVVL
jgi:hypothetical protein